MSKRKMIYFLIAGVVGFLGMVLLVIFMGSFSGELIEIINLYEVFIFAGLLGATLWGVRLFMNNSRFTYYAIMGVVFVCAAHFLGIRIWIALALLGVIVETVAVNFLVSFIRQYPTSKE